MEFVALAIFLATYGALSLRNLSARSAGAPIWLVLLLGAAAMVASGSISIQEAYSSINLQIIIFLFSMFTLVTALDISGVLEDFATRMILRARKAEDVIFLTFLGFAVLSAFLMNDTLALMGTPIMISLAKKMRIRVKPLLLILAFSITIGSVATPMGNPQNLLVALVSGMSAPVVKFAYFLALPTVINLGITFLLFRFLYRKEFTTARSGFVELTALEAGIKEKPASDRRLGRVAVVIVVITMAGIVLANVFQAAGLSQPFVISEISLFGAALLLAVSGRSRDIVRSLDWGILVLFASLFVLMEAVSLNGIIAFITNYLPPIDTLNPRGAILAITISAVLLSQVLSNVPMVALYLPLMRSLNFGPADAYAWAALAGGSTIAGNLTLLGAASNLIILEEAERRGHRLGFFEFLKIGVVVTLLNIVVLYAYLYLIV
ncbi:MAG: hypothetical protein HYW93_05395 [Thaumarchaeota archaeon]|nr:hypothetical protein [Nitrososphaerota archaeon]